MLNKELEELLKYKGTNVMPDDFDEYWDRALKELDGVEPNTVYEKSSFQVPGSVCYDIYYDGARNGKVHAKLIKPEKSEGKMPAAIHFHGYGCTSEDWTYYMWLVNMGFVVVAMDVRGQGGGKSVDKNPVSGDTTRGHIIRGIDEPDADNMFYRQVFLDTVQTARVVMNMEDVDKDKVCAFGGSQGGALTIACAALVPEINRIAPGIPFLSDYKKVYDIKATTSAYSEIFDYFAKYDIYHEREDEIFKRLGYIDVHNLAKKVKAKVLFGAALMDGVAPTITQFAVYNNINSEKEIKIYYDYGHETLPQFNNLTAEFFAELL